MNATTAIAMPTSHRSNRRMPFGFGVERVDVTMLALGAQPTR